MVRRGSGLAFNERLEREGREVLNSLNMNLVSLMQGEWYNQEGLQKQMLFMRCVYESQVNREIDHYKRDRGQEIT
jgi:hypothetical protein